MGFLLNKAVHVLVQPMNTIIALLLIGWLLGRVGRRRTAGWATRLAVLYAALIMATPAPEALMRGLENRFPPADPAVVAVAAGAIVLGGSTDNGEAAQERRSALLGPAAERVTAILALRQTRPDLPVLHSGGSGALERHGWMEGEIVRRFLAEAGVDPASVRYEERSRTTYENAFYSAEMLAAEPFPGAGPILLVTSAWHMPRAMATFRAAGLDVAAYPVDFRAPPLRWSLLGIDTLGRLETMTRALIEVVGLLGYRALGRTDTLFPAP